VSDDGRRIARLPIEHAELEGQRFWLWPVEARAEYVSVTNANFAFGSSMTERLPSRWPGIHD